MDNEEQVASLYITFEDPDGHRYRISILDDTERFDELFCKAMNPGWKIIFGDEDEES